MYGLWTGRRTALPAAICLLLTLGVSSPTTAREVKVPGPMLDRAAAGEFPKAVFDKITGIILSQATFVLPSPSGSIRSRQPTTTLVEFVQAPSQNDPDTYLYVMRYVVTVPGGEDSPALDSMSCQVVIVYKYGEYDEPTVMCERLSPDEQGYPT